MEYVSWSMFAAARPLGCLPACPFDCHDDAPLHSIPLFQTSSQYSFNRPAKLIRKFLPLAYRLYSILPHRMISSIRYQTGSYFEMSILIKKIIKLKKNLYYNALCNLFKVYDKQQQLIFFIKPKKFQTKNYNLLTIFIISSNKGI